MRTVEKITFSINGQDEKYVLYVPTADPNCGEQAALQVQNSLKKLYEYEELEEQGKLVVLPCKVGDTFWEIQGQGTENAFCYPRIAHSLSHCVYALERLGKTTFITEEAAKEALRKEQ